MAELASCRPNPAFNAAVSFIDRHIEEGRGGRVALRWSGGEETFAELAAGVGRAGNALLGLGFVPGDRLVMLVRDEPAFFHLFFGAIRAGVVPVPLNTRLKAREVRPLLDDSGCRGIAYSPEFAPEVEPAVDGSRVRIAIPTAGGAKALDGLMAEVSETLAPAPVDPDDACFWLYSSGTTGMPKGAIHRHRDLGFVARRYGVETLGVRPDDVCFSAARLFFAYGLGNTLAFPLWTGATAVLETGRPTPETTLAVIEKFRPTLFFAVPTHYAALLRTLETERRDLSSLRLCVSAGEALPAPLLERWRKRTGLDILDGIGATETLHIFISNRPGEVRPGTTGTVVLGYEVRIVDDAGAEPTPGQPGHLLVRGESIARQYWSRPHPRQAVDEAGWLRTGDTFSRDAEGVFRFHGRSDDMLKVGGLWCSPVEIEALLLAHPGVVEAAVVGNPDADGLDKPEAFVVPAPTVGNRDTLARELGERCRAALPAYKQPCRFVLMDRLPRSATGKIQRHKLRVPRPETVRPG